MIIDPDNNKVFNTTYYTKTLVCGVVAICSVRLSLTIQFGITELDHWKLWMIESIKHV